MNHTSGCRLIRLQFSLRALLITMSLMGVGLTIYRWPWVVTKTDQSQQVTTTTYRRGWNGKPLRHGTETFVSSDSHFRETSFYLDDDKRREMIEFVPEKMRGIAHYRLGKKEGTYLHEWSDGLERGSYRQDLKDGRWRLETRPSGEDRMDVESEFVRGLPHGLWTWSIHKGRLLQSARFEGGRLVEWNGQPVDVALANWLRTNQVPAGTQAALLSRLNQIDPERWSPLDDDTLEWAVRGSDHRLVLRDSGENGRHSCYLGSSPSIFAPPKPKADDPCIGEVLIANALQRNQTVSYRFGVVCFVSLNERELHWQDTTGVSQVSFAAGSPSEAAWLEPVREKDLQFFDRACRFQSLFLGAPIQIDTREFGPDPTEYVGVTNSFGWGYMRLSRRASQLKRSRRDILGLILQNYNWSCEQRGNVLILHPYSADD